MFLNFQKLMAKKDDNDEFTQDFLDYLACLDMLYTSKPSPLFSDIQQAAHPVSESVEDICNFNIYAKTGFHVTPYHDGRLAALAKKTGMPIKGISLQDKANVEAMARLLIQLKQRGYHWYHIVSWQTYIVGEEAESSLYAIGYNPQ